MRVSKILIIRLKGKADKLLIKAKKSDVPAALALHTASTAGSAPFTW